MEKYKFRTLYADEIEVRIGQVIDKPNYKGVSLLLYKNARVDMDILDETVGADYWQREPIEIKGNLYCRVGIYNETLKDWVWKSDCGTESNAEKEKGESSDAFKRACVNWGIGRELYTSPDIWYQGELADIKKYKFYVNHIAYNDKRRITELEIRAKFKKEDLLIFAYSETDGGVQNIVPKKTTCPALKIANQQQDVPFPKTGDKTTETQNTSGDITLAEALAVSLKTGKHANVAFKNVPEGYLRWIAENYKEERIKKAAKLVIDYLYEVKNSAKQQKQEYLEELNSEDLGDIPF